MKKIMESTDTSQASQQTRNQKPLIFELPGLSIANDDAIDLRLLWNKALKRKWQIIIVATIFMLSALATVFVLPNQYKSDALLAPVSSSDAEGLSSLVGKFGGLAKLAGLNVGKGAISKPALAIEIMKSREFVKKFIQKHNILVPLMATKEWDSDNDKLIIDEELFDVASNKWVREVSPPKRIIPTFLEAHERFLEIFEILHNKETSLVEMSIQFYSPQVSAQWLEWIIKDINEHMREMDKTDARKNIEYLQAESKATSLNNMKLIFSELIEEQTKTVMLANVKKQYVFKMIDPPIVPEKKTSPRRELILVLTTLLGLIIGTISVLVRDDKQNA